MALRITNNIQSINAQRNVTGSQMNLQKALEKLSSGLRINRAGDDAAGLAISEKLRSNIRALRQASRNGNDGIALIQVAEGAMNEVSNMLIRMKELAEQAATGTIGTVERGYLDLEYQQLREEIDRISDNTKFNDTQLLDGSLSIDIQIGVSNGTNDVLSINLSDTDTTALGSDLEHLVGHECPSRAQHEHQRDLHDLSAPRHPGRPAESLGVGGFQPGQRGRKPDRGRVAHPRRGHRGGNGQPDQVQHPAPSGCLGSRPSQPAAERGPGPAPVIGRARTLPRIG